VANALGRVLLAPLAVLPGWLSATLVSVVTGVLMLITFKYTSNQQAIKRVRSDIKANLLSLKLFKESAGVVLRAQAGVLIGALKLFGLAIVPMCVMLVPVTLVLGQLAAWYQARPLAVGEETVVTLSLADLASSARTDVCLKPIPAIETTVGPVRVLSKREVSWNIKAREPGYHVLAFRVGDASFEKELAIGHRYMRVSMQRPAWRWTEALLFPTEPPFARGSPVQSIEIAYPERDSWTSGTDWWVIYWLVVSMIAALCFRRAFNVHI
jgi:hypothetical protein